MKERKILLILITIFAAINIYGIKLLIERTTNILDLSKKISQNDDFIEKNKEDANQREKLKQEIIEELQQEKITSTTEANRDVGLNKTGKFAKSEIDDVISVNVSHATVDGKFIAIKFENFENYKKLDRHIDIEMYKVNNIVTASGIIGIPNYSRNDFNYARKQANIMVILKSCIDEKKTYDIFLQNNDELGFPSIVTIKEKNDEYVNTKKFDNESAERKEDVSHNSDTKIKSYVGRKVSGSSVKMLLEDIVASGDYIAFTYKNISSGSKKNGTIGKAGYTGNDKTLIEERHKDILAFKFNIDTKKKYNVSVKYKDKYITEVIVEEIK